MMDKKSYLKFSKDGTNFCIVFPDGTESHALYSKEEGFQSVLDWLENKQITDEDAREMRDKIINAENLPWGIGKNFLYGPIAMMVAFAVIETVRDVVDYFDGEHNDATFKLCGCGEMHGRIYFKYGFTYYIKTKKQGFEWLDFLKKYKHVSEEEYQKVKKEIEDSGLS